MLVRVMMLSNAALLSVFSVCFEEQDARTVETRATLDSIGANFGSMKMASQAPLGIVVCGDLEATFPEEGRDYWIEDTSAAMENLLLAAHSIGLGAVWCGIYPMTDRVQAFSEMLSLPENIIPMESLPRQMSLRSCLCLCPCACFTKQA